MTIREAIARTDAVRANAFNEELKISWLSRLDGMVKKLVIDTHEGGEAVTFDGYGSGTDPDTQLLVPAPFDDIYLRWLEAQIDYAGGEFGRYNNAIVLFNAAFGIFQNHYNRSHLPAPGDRRFAF